VLSAAHRLQSRQPEYENSQFIVYKLSVLPAI
jgi:hypothetical protein